MYFMRHKNLIPAEMVQQIRDELKPEDFSIATFNDGLNFDFRQNYDLKLTPTHVSKLEPFILPVLPQEYQRKKLVGIDQDSAYALGYQAGNFFNMHSDGYSYNRRGERSRLTIQVYLTASVEAENLTDPQTQSVGGQTVFQDFDTENHGIGDVIIFDHQLVHGGAEVLDGIKITIRLNAIYTNLSFFEDMNDHCRHLRLQPAVTFERKLTPNSFVKMPMDPMYDICTSCYGYTRIDQPACQICQSQITIIPEVYAKRLHGWFMPA